MKKFPKDAWIRDALIKRYLVCKEDGTIYRCKKADKTGNLLSTEYDEVTQQTHKKTGRVYFTMTWRGFTKSVLVNRVIAWRYHPNPLNLPQVNHIDGIKAHNNKDNLEWSSGSDNEKHAHRTGLKTGRGSANSNAKLTAADVSEMRASTDTPKALSERFGVAVSTVNNILKRNTWKHI